MERSRDPDHRILAVAPCADGQLLNAVVIASHGGVESPVARSLIAAGLAPACGSEAFPFLICNPIQGISHLPAP